MTDIVDRLRHCSENCGDEYLHELAGKAADEIEWLRATLREIVLITDRRHDAWDRAKLLLGGQL